MQIAFLKENPEAIPVIAQWYYEKWGHLSTDNSVIKIEKELLQYCQIEQLPLMLVGSQQEKVIATAQLKFREMKIYPDKEHWLGGVFVAKQSRGKGVASMIISEIERVALNLNVPKLYLQTERLNGGLYARLGWHKVEQVNYRGTDVLVMEKELVI